MNNSKQNRHHQIGPIDQVQRQHQTLTAVPLAFDLLNTVPDGLVVLNAQRQIVYTNDRFRQVTVGLKAMEVIGLRPR
ncbi:MAG: PAS domain-containing protein [Dehalococcoidia bacterium]|nr:PAS domain-containing protein [Dehalococcoidia bacterium]